MKTIVMICVLLFDGALGLTWGETNAFHRAWDVSLFGADQSAADMPTQVWPGNLQPIHARGTTVTTILPAVTAAPGLPPQPTDSLSYFLPPAVIEQLSTLELSPHPTRVVRVIAVWLELPSP